MRHPRINSRIFAYAGALVLGGACLLVGKPEPSNARPLQAQQRGQTVRVSIMPSATALTEGEPLTLSYQIENHWDREVLVSFAAKQEWLTVSLVRLDGSQIKAVYVRPPGPNDKAALVRPDDHFPEERVIRWETPPPPGEYQLRTSVQLPYAATAETFDDEVIAAGKKSIYKATFLTPVTVSSLDPERLSTFANRTKDKLLTPGPRNTPVLCQQLFALPAAYFHPILVELARTPNLDWEIRQAVVTQLRLQKDVEAADLIAEMAWENEYPKVGDREARWQAHCVGALRLMYKGADATLKSHMDNIAARYKVDLSDAL